MFRIPGRCSAELLKAGALAAALTVAVAVPVEAGCSVNDYTGSICVTAGSFCPSGYLPLNGRFLPIIQFNALFSLVGCRWGGDCQSTFALPDFRGRVAVGTGQGPGLTDIYPGYFGGVESTAIGLFDMPRHIHVGDFKSSSSDVTIRVFDGLAESTKPTPEANALQMVTNSAMAPAADAKLYGPGTGDAIDLGGVEIESGGEVTLLHTGKGDPVAIRNPVLAFNFCIKVEAPYPPRN